MSASSTDGGDVLSITDSQINFANILAFTSTIPGTCVCFLVLIAYAVAACFPQGRKQLDRVSFRLLVCTLIFNVLFGIAYAATPASPGTWCNFGAFVVNFTLSFSIFFTTCIAVNLELVLVHGVNGKRMEKYYLISTTFLSLALNVPPFVLHQFGWDEESSTCWYKNPDPKERLRWIIGTQSFWIALAATIETVCSCVVLFWMYRFHANTRLIQKAVSTSIGKSSGTASHAFTSSSSSTAVVSQDPRYRKIILRIALYPIVSLMANFSTVVLDLNTTIRGMHTQGDYRLLILDLILYGVRTLAYGLLAAGDPSFINAIRQLRTAQNHTDNRTLTGLHFASSPARFDNRCQSDEGKSDFASSDDTEVPGRNSKESKIELDVEEMRNLERQL